MKTLMKIGKRAKDGEFSAEQNICLTTLIENYQELEVLQDQCHSETSDLNCLRL